MFEEMLEFEFEFGIVIFNLFKEVGFVVFIFDVLCMIK